MTPTKMRAFTTIMATSKSILAQTMVAAAVSNDEETVMSQPVTYTGPAVETNFGTGDFSLDDLDLGTGVAPVDETSPFVFDANMLSQITNIRGTTPPQTNWVGIIRKKHKC
jgi:hypothetical protein